MGHTVAHNVEPGKNRTTYVTSIISISLVMLLFGVVGWLLINAHHLSIYIKENLGLSIEISNSASELDVHYIRKKLDAAPYIRETRYISKIEAAEILKQNLSENFLEFLGDENPLPATIECKLRAPYANADSIAVIEKQLKTMTHVAYVSYQKSLIDVVNRNISKISAVLLLFCGLLFSISIALINNSVRSAVYARRFLIHTMKLVGATPAFIRQPFLYVSLRNGIFSGIIAILFLIGFYLVVGRELGTSWEQFFSIGSSFILFIALLLISTLISTTATYFALAKYIDMDKDKLYR